MDEATNDAVTPDGQGKNDTAAEGAATGTASNAGKSFTQDQVNSLVQARLAEERTRAQKRFDDKLAAALEAAKGDVDKLVETKLAERVAQQALESTRTEIQEQYGLTESQAKRLNGATPEELRADAKELFGKFVPQKDPVAEMCEAVKTKTGLTDKQMERLKGDTEEAMIADAVELFGVKVNATPDEPAAESKAQPKPPVLQSGQVSNQPPPPSAMDSMDPSEVRKNWRKLWPTQ